MDFLTEPNLPDRKVKRVLMQTKYMPEYNKFQSLDVFQCNNLNLAEKQHCDMQIVHLGNNTFLTEESCFDYYKNLLNDAEIIKGNAVKEQYPFNIAFNVCIIGKKVFCYEKYTDKKIIEYALANGMQIINVKQGYVKCSTSIVSHNAVITSDKGLYKIYKQNNIDVLLISTGNIVLEGYDYGFIGGCSGKIDKDILWFHGDIKRHPNYNEIFLFCKKHNCNIEYIDGFPLTDIGSVLPISYN